MMKRIYPLFQRTSASAVLILGVQRMPPFGWWGWHMPWMWIFFPLGGFAVFLILIALVLFLLLRRPSERAPRPESALDILKKRYARGELSREEFEKMRQDILGK